jgi:hypothetical protein
LSGIPKLRVEKEDQEIIGLCEDGRIVYKQSAMELEYISENKIEVAKQVLHKCGPSGLTMRNDLLDVEIYVCSRWILDLLAHKHTSHKILDLKSDLLPYLIARAFQDEEYLFKNVPGLKNRNSHRQLHSVEKWCTNRGIDRSKVISANANAFGSANNSAKSNIYVPDIIELADHVAECVFGGDDHDHHQNTVSAQPTSASENSPTNDENLTAENVNSITAPVVPSITVEGYRTEESEDLIRVFGCVFEHGMATLPTPLQAHAPPNSFAPPFFARLTQLPTYVALNREVPLMIAAAASSGTPSLWTPVTGYLVKEQSIVGKCTANGYVFSRNIILDLFIYLQARALLSRKNALLSSVLWAVTATSARVQN